MSLNIAYHMKKKEAYPLSKRIPLQHARNDQDNGELRGRDVNWRSGINTIDQDHGLAPLMLAALQGKKDIAIALIDRGAEIELIEPKKARTALHFAAKAGHADVIQELLKRAAIVNSVDKFLKTPLMHAAKGGYVDCVQALLRRGAGVNMTDDHGFTALHYAARFGHHDVVKVLLDAAAAVEIRDDVDGYTALHFAAQYGRKESLINLLNAGSKVNRRTTKEKLTALMLASREGNKTIVSILISKGAEANIIDLHGWTSLHYAASWGRRDTAHILVVEGMADLNARDKNPEVSGGAPPLVVAAKGGHVEVVKLLIHYGADINLQDLHVGDSALAAAATLGLSDVIQCLLDYHANINLQNFITGTTALMSAAAAGKRGAIIALLNNYADMNILDNRSYTALEHAIQSNHRDILLSAIVHLNPHAKVNLIPWLELEVPNMVPGSMYGGPSVFVNSVAYSTRGLFYGLYKLTGDHDSYLIYALAMMAAACKNAIYKHPRNQADLEMKIDAINRMLVRCIHAKGLCSEEVFADCFILGSHPCQQLGAYDPKYFNSAFYFGPLALLIDNNLGHLLNTPHMQDKIHTAFLCCQKEAGVEVDGYGLRSGFYLHRYVPAIMFLLEGVGQVVYLILLFIYACYIEDPAIFQPNLIRAGFGFSNTEILVALMIVSLWIYECGLMEEKRWAISPSIIFDFKVLEQQRIRNTLNHFMSTPWKCLDGITCILGLSWLVIRIVLATNGSNLPEAYANELFATSSQVLIVSVIPTAIGLLRYPAMFIPSLGIELYNIFLIIQDLLVFLCIYIMLGLGFGIVYYAVYRWEIHSFSTPGYSLQTLFDAVMLNYDDSLFSRSANYSLGVVMSISFLVISVVIVFNAIIGNMSFKYHQNAKRAAEWYILQKAKAVQQYGLVLEKSALSMLPPPFSLLAAAFYGPHLFYTWRNKVSLMRRTCISLGGAISDVVLATVFVLPCATYEYVLINVVESTAGAFIKLLCLAMLPFGVLYTITCMLWKMCSESPIRMIVKSRLSDGRLRMSYSVKRDYWEMNSLARFEDVRMFKYLKNFNDPVFADVYDKNRIVKKIALASKYGGNVNMDVDDEDEQLPYGSSRRSVSLWTEFRNFLNSFGRRDTDYRGKNIRIAPATAFVQLENVGKMEEVKSGIPDMQTDKLKMYSTTELLGPLPRQQMTVLTGRDVHSDHGGSLIMGQSLEDNNSIEQFGNEKPSLLWTQEQAINPYQPGILSHHQWNQLTAEVEPSNSMVLSTYAKDHKSGISDKRNGQIPMFAKDQDKKVRKQDLLDEQSVTDTFENDDIAAQFTGPSTPSFYFQQHKFPPIFTALERKEIFEIVLPEVFVDDFAHAVENNVKHLMDMETRVRSFEGFQHQQLQLMTQIFDKLQHLSVQQDYMNHAAYQQQQASYQDDSQHPQMQ